MRGMDNGHLTVEQLRKYIRNELSPSERELADQELLVCEGCMWRFVTAMEEAERGELTIIPDDELPDMAQLEERVMAELIGNSATMAVRAEEQVIAAPMPSVQETQEAAVPATSPLSNGEMRRHGRQTPPHRHAPRRRGSWLQHPVTHYAIAASITLLLVATGALTGFSEKMQHIEEADGAEPKPHLSIGAEWRNEPSWSDRLVHQAGSFLDGVQALRFNK